MSEMKPFVFEDEALVRVIMIDGEPWFVAADVCRVLEIVNVSQAVDRLDADEVTLCQIEGSHRPTNVINESGLWSLVLRSDKPAAKRFKKWVTAEVLPSIRKTGRYDAAPELSRQSPFDGLLDPDIERMWQGRLALAHRILGKGAAKRLWDMSPMPQVANESPFSSKETAPDLDPEGCLRKLLDWVPRGTERTIEELIAERANPDAVRFLRHLGILPDPKGWDGWVAVSNTARTLAQLFSGSPWRANWSPALLQLPEARRYPGVIHFHIVTRAVLIKHAAE